MYIPSYVRSSKYRKRGVSPEVENLPKALYLYPADVSGIVAASVIKAYLRNVKSTVTVLTVSFTVRV
jgi:hypothetical protein